VTRAWRRYYSNLSLTTVSPTFGLASGDTLVTLAGDGLEFVDTGAGWISHFATEIGSNHDTNTSSLYAHRPK
jgi:hypothetical protein